METVTAVYIAGARVCDVTGPRDAWRTAGGLIQVGRRRGHGLLPGQCGKHGISKAGSQQ